jgi:succinate dehydrogenase / fumarate reductase cytochrome b subunit
MSQPLKSNRPLSPHLQYYKPQMTSVLSIFHRMSGIANAVGLVMVTAWLLSAAIGADLYQHFTAFMASPLGLLMLFGWTLSIYYHLCSGIRHLIFDTGRMMKIKHATQAGYVILGATFLFTALTWAVALL